MKIFPLLIVFVLFFSLPALAQTEVEKIAQRAKLLHLDNKADEAMAEINKAIGIEPQNADLYLTRAEFFYSAENKPEVLRDAQKAASLQPTDRRVLYFSGEVLRRSGQLKEALTIADQLLALGEVDRFGWSLRIQIKMQLEDIAGAFEDVTTALELFPKENMFKLYQATLIRLMSNSEIALKIYDKVIASSEKKLPKAKNEDEKAQIIRDLTNFLFSRAGYYLSKSNTELALADLIKVIDYAPQDNNYFRRAKIYREIKMFPEAVADLTKALEVLKQFDKVQILIERGDIYVFTEKYDEALKDYEEALKLDAAIKEIYDGRMAWLNRMREKSPNQPK